MEGIRAGIELVLGKEKYRDVAQRVAAEMRALPAVDEFLSLDLERRR
jgi:hypothetical protein